MLDALKEAIVKVVNDTVGRAKLRTGKVVSVDPVGKSAEVIDDETQFTDVVSFNRYVEQVPVVGSTVCYGVFDLVESRLEILSADELLSLSLIVASVQVGLDKQGLRLAAPVIRLNDGQNGGLVVAAALVERINRLEQRLLTHQHLCTAPGTPSVVDPATNPPLVPTTVAQITNPNVLH